jgi:hypothetical protein
MLPPYPNSNTKSSALDESPSLCLHGGKSEATTRRPAREDFKSVDVENRKAHGAHCVRYSWADVAMPTPAVNSFSHSHERLQAHRTHGDITPSG